MNLIDMQRDLRAWLIGSAADTQERMGASAAIGLTVYQNNYRAQLVGCLQASFPQLLAWLGDELFLKAAITHIDSHPPHAWTLDAYGIDFGKTLKSMFPHNPDVHELAWIEWALSESFVATDAPHVSGEMWHEVDWDNACLSLSPSLRQCVVSTNASDIWSALEDGVAAPESEMLEAPGGLIVWRSGFSCRIKSIDSVEHAALLSLRDDARFSALCDAMVEHLGEEAGIAKAGAFLADWIAGGIVVGVRSE